MKSTLPFFLCCICQGEKWLAQGSVTHTHLITFLGPTELSQAVVDAGAVPLLVLCIQEPEIALKRIAASTLSDISKHSPELAQTVVDAGAVAHLAQMILNPDAKLKVFNNKVKQTCGASYNPRKWKCARINSLHLKVIPKLSLKTASKYYTFGFEYVRSML